ncbi:MAG: hypothetical protein OEY29_03480 [Gammaproteobacteria bacterium]|nr:hypothetical protein [Gammaproteobacteria bacterium]
MTDLEYPVRRPYKSALLILTVALGVFLYMQSDTFRRHYKPLLLAYIYSFMDNKSSKSAKNISIGSSTVERMDHERYLACGKWRNRGFGSSVISHSIEYIKHQAFSHNTKSILVYAGENDIAYGKNTKQTLVDFKKLIGLLSVKYPKAMINIFAIKLSPKRTVFSKAYIKLNKDINAYAATLKNAMFFSSKLSNNILNDSKFYLTDQLHLSHEGYRELTREFNIKCKK